jgi:modulator of FtsH protease HflC
MSRTNTILMAVVIALLVVVLSSVYVVDARRKVLVLQFGEVVAQRDEPGLGFKIPFIQSIVSYDGRILGLQTQPQEITPLDDRRLVVDSFVRWRIDKDQLVQFRQAVGTGGEDAAQSRISSIVNAEIREVLGSVPSSSVLSDERTRLMNRIREQARDKARAFGVEIIDVRLTRTDLPEQNLASTFARMRSEREREAADEIARGNEAAQRVRALADRQVVELVSEARKQSEIIRGEADGERNRIYAEAYGQDPEFFAFTRSLTSYQRALSADSTTIVMSPDSDFFSYLGSDRGQAAAQP